MYFILNKPWVLRGFNNAPNVVIDPSGENINPVRIMIETLWDVLIKSDGNTDIVETKITKALENAGLIRKVERNSESLSEEQKYKQFPFDRRDLHHLSLTGKCNLNCLHCFMASEKTRDKEDSDLSLQEMYNIIDQLPGVGVSTISLTGGEPLVYPYLKQVLKRIADKHLTLTKFLTNGVKINEEFLLYLKSLNQKPEFWISFDGLGTHDIIRNIKDTEEKTVKGIELVVKHGFNVLTEIQVNNLTKDKLIETCRFLVGKGVRNLYFIRTAEAPRWFNNQFLDMSISLEDYYETCIQVAKTMFEEKWDIDDFVVFAGFSLNKTKGPFVDSDKITASCGLASTGFAVSHDGQLLLCNPMEGGLRTLNDLDSRTLKNTSLEEMLSDSKYSKIVSLTMGDLKKANSDCQCCEYFSICGGSCRAYGYSESTYNSENPKKGKGSYLHKSSYGCTFYKGGYYKRITELKNKYKKTLDENF